jgi:predicted transcriptional regulator
MTLYGYHMSTTLKTTVYLDASDYRRLKMIAREAGRAPAELIREAVSEYAKRHGHRRLPTSLGAGRGRAENAGTRAEELLAGFGRS